MRVDEGEIRDRVTRFSEACASAGVRLTHQRLEIFRELAQSGDHPDVDAIWRAVRERLPTLSLDTVYRTLWLLNDIGAITTLGLPRERIRFDANVTSHHHFICVRCGLARDFESDDLSRLTLPPRIEALGSVLTTHVEVRGLCMACRHYASDAVQSTHGTITRGKNTT